MTRREVWACTALCAGKRCEKRAIVPCAGEKIDNEGLPIFCPAFMVLGTARGRAPNILITVVGTLCNTRGSHRDRPSLVAQFIFIARAALFGSQKNESGGASDLPFGRRARRCSSRVAGRSGFVSFRRPCATLRRLRAGRLASAGDRHATHVPRQHRGRRSNPAPNAPACPQKSVVVGGVR